mgnify:CR=1 FL=1
MNIPDHLRYTTDHEWVSIEGDVVTHEPLPAGLPEGVILFKVWGAAPDAVWAIGEQGVQLHFDGETWTYEPVAGAPRLVTLHGDGEGDIDDLLKILDGQ